jgi:hypothetical protein
MTMGGDPRAESSYPEGISTMSDPAMLEENAARYPLSTQQQLCCDEESIGDRFILAYAMRIKGELDVVALRGALDDLVVRHEVLRTRITCGCNGEPNYQTVLPAMPVPFEVYQLATEPGPARDDLADEILVKLNAERMDMSQLPLLRAELHRFDDRDAVLTILTHHSAGDGWSTGLHKRDLAALYQARLTGTPAELPEIQQYREFAAWQRDRIDSERGAAARTFWHDKLADTQVFTMPSDRRNGEGVLHSPYGAANFSIPAEEVLAFEAAAASARSTGWHALLAAEALLAHRLRGMSDITLMTNVAGRAERKFADTVGFFADFVPLRLNLDGCETFADVLLQSRSTCLEAMRYPLPINVIEAGLPHFTEPYDNPETMPFIFNYARPLYESEEYQFADSVELITLREEEPGDRGGWCIWSMLRETSGAIRGSIEYPPDLVDASTVEGWVAEFRRLLSLIAHAPHQNWKDR